MADKDKSPVGQIIRRLIDEWIANAPANERRSRNLLCRMHPEIKRRNLSRIENEGQYPSFAMVQTICSALNLSISQTKELFGEFYPNEMSLWLTHHHHATQLDEPVLKEIAKNPDLLLVHALAGRDGGTSMNEVLQLLGAEAVPAIERLIDMEVVNEKNGKLTAEEYSVRTADVLWEFVNSETSIVLRNLERSNAITNQIDGLNSEGLNILREGFKTFSNLAQSIRKDPKYKGNIPVATFAGIAVLADICDNVDET